MVFTSLGIFSTIFNWVLEKIFSPVFTFISGLLETVLGWLFEEILGPLLKSVIWPIIERAIGAIITVLSGVLYSLLSCLLRLVDQMEAAFDIFIGLREVSSKSYGNGSLLTVLYQMKPIKTAFWLILFIGLGIAFLLTIYATAKSAFDLDFENKRPVSKVLSSFMKTFFYFFMIPFLVLVMIQLSGTILKGMDRALTPGENKTTLGRMVFVVSSLDAAKLEQYNISNSNQVHNIGIEDDVRKQFYNGSYSYTEKKKVEEYFVYEKFDYLVGFGMGIFLLIIMASCLVVFVQRIFDIIVLYLVSPFFVAIMPLDDGEKFKRWRELFLGKCFTGFGSVAAMKIYLMLCPVIMGNQISFAKSSSVESTYLIKMIFMLGGAWAVLKSGPMITTLLSSASGGTEQQTGTAANVAFTGAAMKGAGLAAAGVSWGVGKISPSRNKSLQKFEEMQKDAPGSSGIPGISEREMARTNKEQASEFEPGSSGRKAAAEILPEMAGHEESSTGTADISTPETAGRDHSSTEMADIMTPETAACDESTPGTAADSENERLDEPDPGTADIAEQETAGEITSPTAAPREEVPQIVPKRLYSTVLGLGIDRNRKGNKALAVRWGNFFTAGHDEKGNFRLKVLGANFKWDSKGNFKQGGFRFLGKDLFKSKRGSDGKFHLSKLNITGAKFKTDKTTNQLYFSRLSMIGLKREIGPDKKAHLTKLGALGLERKKLANGEYRTTSCMWGMVRQIYGVDQSKKSSVFATRILGMNLYKGYNDKEKDNEGDSQEN